MSRILTLDASMAVCAAGLVEDERVLGWHQVDGDVAALPSLAAALLAEHGRPLDLVAVIVGPGSFTGLRASVALAHGIGLAAGVPVVGVTVGNALASEDGRPVWAVVDSKRGRVFLERSGSLCAVTLEALPLPTEPISLGGDAARAAAAVLTGHGADVRLLATPLPEPLGIARAARAGRTVTALPSYVDPPAARPGPPGRPAPA